MKTIRYIFILSITIGYISNISGQSQSENGAYLPMSFPHNGTELLYNIMYPNNFDDTKSYPLVVFLHGVGERGNDNKKQLVHGSKIFQDSIDNYPAIVIFPQCPEDDFWAKIDRSAQGQFRFDTIGAPNPSLGALIELIENKLDLNYIDNNRLYIAGLSMGGMGTLELAWRINDKIAAAIPICGAGSREKAIQMTNIPFWFFHGVDDSVVPVRFSRMMLESIQMAGGKAKITLFPDTNHNSWDSAFADPEFLSWLFSKKKL